MALLSVVSDEKQHEHLERTFCISLGIHVLWNVSDGGNITLPHPARLNRPVFLLKYEADNSSELYLCFS